MALRTLLDAIEAEARLIEAEGGNMSVPALLALAGRLRVLAECAREYAETPPTPPRGVQRQTPTHAARAIRLSETRGGSPAVRVLTAAGWPLRRVEAALKERYSDTPNVALSGAQLSRILSGQHPARSELLIAIQEVTGVDLAPYLE